MRPPVHFFPFSCFAGFSALCDYRAGGVRIGFAVTFGARAACCPREFRIAVDVFLWLQVIRMCDDARRFVFGTRTRAFALVRSCGGWSRLASRLVARRSREVFATRLSGASDSTWFGFRDYTAASVSRRDGVGQLAERLAGRW